MQSRCPRYESLSRRTRVSSSALATWRCLDALRIATIIPTITPVGIVRNKTTLMRFAGGAASPPSEAIIQIGPRTNAPTRPTRNPPDIPTSAPMRHFRTSITSSPSARYSTGLRIDCILTPHRASYSVRLTQRTPLPSCPLRALYNNRTSRSVKPNSEMLRRPLTVKKAASSRFKP